MITSNANKNIKNIIKLRDKSKVRNEQGLFMAEGSRMVLETPKTLLKELYISEEFLSDSEKKSEVEGYLSVTLDGLRSEEYLETFFDDNTVKVFLVANDIMKLISDTTTPQGILAVIEQKRYMLEDILEASKVPSLIILEKLQDPGNLGTILRTAEGAGISGIVMSRDTVDPFSPKVIRSTMGSMYRVPFFITDDICDTINVIKKTGVKVFAAHLKGEKYYDELDFRGASAFLIGNEGNGLSDEVASLADTYLKIPMEGQLESLNAAMAAGILMYETSRQRRQ